VETFTLKVSMKHLYKLLIFIGLGCAVSSANAQQHTFFQATETFDHSQFKHAIQAVVDLDPMAKVFASDDMRVLQIVHNGSITPDQLRSLITSTGLQLQPGTPDLNALYGTAPNVPMYVPTGDAAADHARYVDAVNEWNAAHPDQQMPQPLPYADEN
jgi:hypothetical protein